MMPDNTDDRDAFIARYGRKTYDEAIAEKFDDGSTPDCITSWENEAGERDWSLAKLIGEPEEIQVDKMPVRRLRISHVYRLDIPRST